MLCDVTLSHGLAADGRMVQVAAVPSGLECDCRCPECGSRLVAKKGPILRHHFAHDSDSACPGAFETMAHRLAKQIIADEKRLFTPEVGATLGRTSRTVRPPMWLSFDSVEMEIWRAGLRPDIVAHVHEKELAIEVFVTHRCEEEKISILRSRASAAIEIDLSNLRRDFDTEQFRSAVLRDAPRWWIFNALSEQALAEMQHERANMRSSSETSLRAKDVRARAEALRDDLVRRTEVLRASTVLQRAEAVEKMRTRGR